MKNITPYLLSLFVLSLCVACAQADKPAEALKKESSEVATKAKKQAKMNPKAKKASSNTLYWTDLQKDFGLEADKVEALRELNATYNAKVRSLFEDKPDGVQKMIKKLREEEKAEMKKLLGAERYAEKLAWDKEWTQKQQKK